MSGVPKRDRILQLLEGKSSPDYVPAAFFLHFGETHRFGDAAIRKHEEFFRATDMDFVKIQFELSFPQQTMSRPEDWVSIPFRDETFYEPQLAVIRELVQKLKSEAIVVCTLYSPFMIAGQIGGEQTLIDHMQKDPERVNRGVQIVYDSLMVFIREAVALGLDGFYHSTQGGESQRFTDPTIFENWVKPVDLSVMREVRDIGTFSILHICDYNRATYGGYSSLDPFLDYPGDVVNAEPVGSLTDMLQSFDRPIMGGLDRLGVLATGSPDQIKQAARKVLDAAPELFILGADCTVPGNTPWASLRTAVDEAHKGK
jgi:uroporphyrinogen decarboxylase